MDIYNFKVERGYSFKRGISKMVGMFRGIKYVLFVFNNRKDFLEKIIFEFCF